MKAIILGLIGFSALLAQAQSIILPDGATYTLSTNYVTNVVSTVRVEEISTPCPECGGPDHHERLYQFMISYGNANRTLVVDGHTNVIISAVGPTNRWFATNVVLKLAPAITRQPGWQINPTYPLFFTTNLITTNFLGNVLTQSNTTK